MNYMDCKEMVAAAKKKFPGRERFRIVTPDDPNYDAARVISNSRINLYPWAIAYCKLEEHIAFFLEFCATNNLQFRIRSGGHQHEGMCSGNNVLVIDVSEMDEPIEFLSNNQAWIRPGKLLGDGKTKGVYFEVKREGLVIPGGGCETVSIGGIVQGGGWGPSARMYGLTCDSLLAAQAVLANGTVVEATANNKYKDLYWAIRGGGGGNFCVVTKLKFQLYRLGATTSFTITWKRADRDRVTDTWIQLFSGEYRGLPPRCYKPGTTELVPNITSGMRLSVVADDNNLDKPALQVSGVFYGTEADARMILKPLLDIPPSKTPVFAFTPAPARAAARLRGAAATVDAHIAFGRAMQSGPPTETCDAPHPHKISSGFPVKAGDWRQLREKLVAYVAKSQASDDVNLYMSLMSMGGKIKEMPLGETPFPYRDKPFVMQPQAWWSDPSNPNGAKYVKWIEDFRDALVVESGGKKKELVEGAFINFPDKSIGKLDIRTIPGRVKLLRYYYGKYLTTLMLRKTKYDRYDLFSFEMSIPVFNTRKTVSKKAAPKRRSK
jgi:hypothetical protein